MNYVSNITLKRGIIGSLNFYAWLDQIHNGDQNAMRTLGIHLQNEDQSTVVLTWRFDHVRPVSLSYSPLRTMDGGILMETLILKFDRMEML